MSNQAGKEKGLQKLGTIFFTDSWVGIKEYVKKISTDTMGWVATVAFHLSTIPTLMSVVSGINDRVPTSDVVLFIWVGLMILMIRSIIQRDYINVLINSIGLFAQVCLFTLIVFK
jgi:lipid-A-disaccharide synthase-like uncharacterized protein